MVEMQGDGSWTGRQTQTLLWSSILRPKCPPPAQGRQAQVQGGAYSLTATPPWALNRRWYDNSLMCALSAQHPAQTCLSM